VALFAHLAGAYVVVLDRDPERAAMAEVIAKADSTLAGDDAAQAVGELTGGEGFDVVFDATGNQQAIERGFEFVAHGGRYVLVSVVKESITFADPDFHRREMTLCGSRNATTADFEHVMAAIRGGNLPVDRLITHRIPLREAARSIPVWATQKSGLIKALIEIG
jgi:2-desacetyl-2-hydroxyethyl bacteriochlorophyllide A dehydrogenase